MGCCGKKNVTPEQKKIKLFNQAINSGFSRMLALNYAGLTEVEAVKLGL